MCLYPIPDLLSMIERLSSDNLADQRISPTPVTPEDEEDGGRKSSPGEMRKRSQSQGKKRSPNGHHHRPLANSKSTDSMEIPRFDPQSHGSSHHYMSRHRREKKIKENMLKPPGSGSHFSRTQSGGTILNSASTSSSSAGNTPTFAPRSLSPPANIGSGSSSSQDLRRNLSPPPPTSKPPPLPSHATKRVGGARQQQQQQPPARWSGVSYKSTDSASSEDSLTADLPRHPRQHGPTFGSAEQIQGHMDSRSMSVGSRPGTIGINRPTGSSRDQPQYFPRAHTPNSQGPTFSMSSQQQQEKGKSNRSVPRGGVPPSDYPTHPLDNVVKNAYNSNPASSSGGNLVPNTQHTRKTSWQGKPMDYTNASHPLQMSVSRGHSQSIGSTLSSYPWHSAHSLPHHHKQQASVQPKR